jgi:RHS repeat-associated protein
VIARAHHAVILLLAVLLAAFWPTVAGAHFTTIGAARVPIQLKEEGFTRKTVFWPDSHITLENRAFGAKPAIVFFDGNGNITALMDGNQNIVARYEYDPYGRLIGKWGTMADVNHYRFSSQEFFPNPNIYGYHSRFYDPTLQRWLNRDPFGEAGGLNLYGFVGNNPVGNVDPYGLAFGDWWDPRSYSTAYANAAGASAIQAQLERAGYQSMQEFNLAQRTFQGTFTSGDMSTVQAGAGVAGTGAAIYVNGITMIGQGGIVAKGEEAAAQGIADAAEQGWLSKLWGKCKFWGKEPPPKPGLQALQPMADAAFQTGTIRSLAGYELGGNAGLVGSTYNVNLWGLYATENAQGPFALINALKAEASAAGATQISITGNAVVNQGLMNISPAVANRLGLQFQQINPTTILLQGPVH